MSSSFKDTRRGFFKTTAAFGVGYWVAGRASCRRGHRRRRLPRRRRRRCDLPASAWGARETATRTMPGGWGKVVAICDVDEDKLAKAAQRFPDAKKFYDFRELFDEMSGKIDAVTVSTPDHTHALVAVRAMSEGKAVYCQKPLTHSLWEARRMAEIARETKVVTQMGNQGTAGSGLRRSAAIVQSGALGPVQRSSRLDESARSWPQGMPRPEAKSGAQEPALESVAGSRSAAATLPTVITPRSGAAGGILGPARWATWPATR